MLARAVRIPVFSGFVMSRPLEVSLALRHAGEIAEIGLTRPFAFVSRSFRAAFLFECPRYVFLRDPGPSLSLE